MDQEPIRIILEKCTGCKLCEKVCPYDAIHVIEKKAVVDEKCTLCGACLEACKFDAIVIERRTFRGQDIAAYSGICVYAENRFGKLSSVVPEIIGAARELKKDLPRPISTILPCANVFITRRPYSAGLRVS